MAGTYEPPRIEQRTDIGPMLIGVLGSGNVDNEVSAAFRPLSRRLRRGWRRRICSRGGDAAALGAPRAAVDRGREPLGLHPLPLSFFVVELAHHLSGEQLHRRADVLVANVPALAQEHHLVDAGVGVAAHELAHL